MLKVLIIDGQKGVRNSLRAKLEVESCTAEAAGDLEEGLELGARIPFDVVICDNRIFGELKQKEQTPFRDDPDFIVLSADPSIDSAIDAMRSGAYDYIPKPIDMNKLLTSIRTLEKRRESPEIEIAKYTPKGRGRSRNGSCKVEEIIGNSKKILHVKKLIDKVAPSDARVLITGPNGMGKELVARWLHEKSERNTLPFIEVNCAAIPSELIESELFGHEKGAFTSAVKQRKGKFEQASGGTLFLDEIGDMSLSAQAKVLRALQENRISRVGSDKDVEVDVRVLAATNKNLMDEIEKGNFREDLYHRLSVIVIGVPPLCDRREDIPELVSYFITKISGEYGREPKCIEPDALEELKSMGWSGNIRELRNVVERLIILCGKSITLDDVKMYALGTV